MRIKIDDIQFLLPFPREVEGLDLLQMAKKLTSAQVRLQETSFNEFQVEGALVFHLDCHITPQVQKFPSEVCLKIREPRQSFLLLFVHQNFVHIFHAFLKGNFNFSLQSSCKQV